jgi:hypothetical protein
MITITARHVKALLIFVVVVALSIHLYPTAILFFSNVDGDPEASNQAPSLPVLAAYTVAHNLSGELAFIQSLNLRLAAIPAYVNFTQDEIPRNFTHPQGNRLLVYDIQWVPPQASIVLFVAERIRARDRPPNIGMFRLFLRYFLGLSFCRVIQ